MILIVPLRVMPIHERMEPAFHGLSQYPEFAQRTISGRLYRTWDHAMRYHAHGLRQIADALRQKLRDPSRQSIFLRSDQDVPFGAFATVMDAVKQAGISNVSIVTQPLQEHGSKR